MNLLIVDDQASVVQGLSYGISWKMMGFDNIYKAYNAAEAKEILKRNEVQIMLCDIEMPGENGIKLLNWIHGEGIDTECIFLTAHADFEYMQEAIRARGFDYILQPAPYDEIRKAVYGAIGKVLEKQKRKMVYDYGAAMMSEQCSIRRSVVGGLLDGELGKEQYEKYVAGLNLPAWGQECFLLLLRVNHKVQIEADLMLFILDNVSHELFDAYETEAVVERCKKRVYSVLLYGKGNYLIDREGVVRRSGIFLEHLKKLSAIEISIYISDKTEVSQLKERWERLLLLAENNIMKNVGIFMESELVGRLKGEGEREFYDSIPLKRWKQYLLSGYVDTVRSDITGWLTGAGEKGVLDRNKLYYFYLHFVQMVGSALEEKGILLYDVIPKELKGGAYQDVVHSVPDMLGVVEKVLKQFINAEGLEKNVFSEVREYVREHMGEDIRRMDIAEQVHMHPDYLNRIFKKETGMTLGDYVLNEKMQIARNLLRTTSLPVSYVASRVGYENFSHFSRTYKRSFGIAPSDERK